MQQNKNLSKMVIAKEKFIELFIDLLLKNGANYPPFLVI